MKKKKHAFIIFGFFAAPRNRHPHKIPVLIIKLSNKPNLRSNFRKVHYIEFLGTAHKYMYNFFFTFYKITIESAVRR